MINNYFYDGKTREYLKSSPAQLNPVTGAPLPALLATHTAPPETGQKQAAVWNGEAWDIVEDHRQHVNEQGVKEGGTPYWLPEEGDDYRSPERYMDDLGPLPTGAVTMRPEKPAPTLDEAKAAAIARIDKETSEAILAGFDYEIDPGTGSAETLHFSYDSFDQQNFADSANVALLSMSVSPQTEGLPTSVTWNAYRNHSPEKGGELVRLSFDPAGFLDLYTGGALAHKARQMEIGGRRKAAVAAAETVADVESI